MKSAIPTHCKDNAFFVNIYFVNLAEINWSSSLNLGLITVWACEISKVAIGYFVYFTNRFISVFVGKNVTFGGLDVTFLFLV